MSGGRLVVLDRAGRSVKQYPLPSGMATLGSAAACDIRVLLAAVRPHHATVAVHSAQTIIRNVGEGETFVNGQSVSVAALRHRDVITLGDRSLRWEYAAPTKRQHASPGVQAVPAPARAAGGTGAARAAGAARARRAHSGAAPPPRDRAAQLAIEMNHRASMPASSGGKQVAIVQPQRRDANEQVDNSPSWARAARRAADAGAESEAAPRASPVPANTTKATLWIESRKTSPRRKVGSPAPARASRRSLPGGARGAGGARAVLRHTALKRAHSARRALVKISAPAHIDPTKQAAIMLMTGHTPKSRISLQPKISPTFLVKKPSPVRKTPAHKARKSGRSSKETGDEITPKRASTYSTDRSVRNSVNQSVTILEISDSTGRSHSAAARASRSPLKSPTLSSPKKSALKDLSKKSVRKTESIKFDLSNLERDHDDDQTFMDSEENVSEDDITLHYSDSSRSPSPRRSIHSRSSRMLEKLGTTLTLSPSRTTSVRSTASKKSLRGSMMVQKALSESEHSRTDQSGNTTVASAYKTKTLSPRQNMESYSIVDLVSLDSNDLSKSVYNSADSDTTYGTPQNVSGRKTRSTIDPTILGSSTPYVAHVRVTRSRSSPNVSKRSSRSSTAARRSKSLTTPENKHISVNSTKVSRASRSRSRINDSDLLLLDDTELEDSSPKTSRRTKTKSNAMEDSKQNNTFIKSPEKAGICTPENGHSPVEARTPILSIQRLLDSSRNSASPSSTKNGRKSVNYKRKTIGVLTEPRRMPQTKSKSLGSSARQTILRLSKDSSETSNKTDEGALLPDNEDTVTPRSAVKLVPEAVKNKHSTAKKPQSKRAIIDHLNQSDIVKQLFNSPVKRKLSQSMTEFSRKQLFEDDEIVVAKRPTRNCKSSIALEQIQDDSISNQSGELTPERFVSPISTPSVSPNLSGVKRLFQKNTPENDLRNVKGVKSLLRTHRTRKSATNNLTNITGVKLVFGRSPRNRVSDVGAKEVFRSSPRDDRPQLATLGKTPPNNDLSYVRGVKRLFRKSPNNDLRNVSGVKRTLRKSPKNDLTDVRGVRKMFGHGRKKDDMHEVSGVEELYNTSNHSAHSAHSVTNSEVLFDQLVGKPPVKAVYSKTFSTKSIQKPKTQRRKTKSLHSSLDVITNNVEEWLEKELQKRFHRDEPSRSVIRSGNATAKELQNLATSTVEGVDPIRASRTRNSSIIKKSASEIYGAHTLPIKKRSLVGAGGGGGGGAGAVARPQLPLKKRAVVHSTPVKGRVNMNASELGRVSPIAAVDITRVGDQDTFLTRTTLQYKSIGEEKSSHPKVKTPEASPAKPPPRSPPKSPPRRITRNRKNTTSDKNTKKRRASLVITKKAPGMSPEVDPEETPQESPKTTRARGHADQNIQTPKRTRVRTQKATVVVAKQSPKLKPQPQANANSDKPRPRKTTGTQESPKESQPRRTRGKQTKSRGKENKSDNVQIEKPQAKRGRNVDVEQSAAKRARPAPRNEPHEEKTRDKSAAKTASEPEVKQPRTRGNKGKVKLETQGSTHSEPTTRRGRRVAENVSLPAASAGRRKKTDEAPAQGEKRGRNVGEKPLERTTRGRKVEEKPIEARGKKVENPIEIKPKTRGKKDDKPIEYQTKTRGKKLATQSSAPSEPATRGRRTKVGDTAVPEVKARKRKTVADEEVAPKVARVETRRARRALPGPEAAGTGTGTGTETGTGDVNTRGRTKKVEKAPATPKATRSKKQAAQPKQSPAGDRRQRKTKVEPSPPTGRAAAGGRGRRARR